MSDFGIWVWNLKTLLSNLKSAPSNLSKYEISRKKKCLGPKIAFLGCFCSKMFYLDIFGLDFSKTVLSYLKLPPSNLTKNALFGYFCTRIWEKCCHI